MAKSYTTGSMANGSAFCSSRFVSAHQLLQKVLSLRFAAGVEDEAHAAAGHPAQHQEAPERRPKRARARSIKVCV